VKPSSAVGKYIFLGLIAVQRQVVPPCPLLYVAYLGCPRFDVTGWDDKVSVVHKFAQLVAGGHRIEIARIDNICGWSNTGSLDDTGGDRLDRRHLILVYSAVRVELTGEDR